MKPADRKRLERWHECVRSFGIVALTLLPLFVVGSCVYLYQTPALPVIVSLTDKPIPVPPASQRTYQGDDMKGKHK